MMHVNFKRHCIILYCTGTPLQWSLLPLLWFLCLNSYGKKKEKKNLMDCETWSNVCLSFSCWWLQMCLHSQIAFEAPSIYLYCRRVKYARNLFFVDGCALDIVRKDLGTIDGGLIWGGGCIGCALPNYMRWPCMEEWKLSILIGPGLCMEGWPTPERRR